MTNVYQIMMNQSNESFLSDLDKLIVVFNKLKEKCQGVDLPGITPDFMDNLDMINENYDKIREELGEEMLENFGEPIKLMVKNMIDQLQEELNKAMEEDDSLGLRSELGNIEKKLLNPEISPEEIDSLLDERQVAKQKIERAKRKQRVSVG